MKFVILSQRVFFICVVHSCILLACVVEKAACCLEKLHLKHKLLLLLLLSSSKTGKPAKTISYKYKYIIIHMTIKKCIQLHNIHIVNLCHHDTCIDIMLDESMPKQIFYKLCISVIFYEKLIVL